MSEINWKSLYDRAKNVSFEVIPDGMYHCEVQSATAVTSSTGKPMIKIKVAVVEGPHANRVIMTQLVLSLDNDTALSIFFSDLEALGITPDLVMSLPPGDLEPIATALVGKHTMAKVTQDTWQGEKRNKISRFRPYTGPAAMGAMPGGMPGGGLPGGMPGGMPGAGMFGGPGGNPRPIASAMAQPAPAEGTTEPTNEPTPDAANEESKSPKRSTKKRSGTSGAFEGLPNLPM